MNTLNACLASDNSPRPLAVITGAAKRVGREIALHLAGKGYTIGLHYYQSENEAHQTAQEISSAGMPVVLLPADLRETGQIESMFDRIDESGHPLKILINSASVMPRSDLMKVSSTEWDEIMNVNLKSVWFCCQQAAIRMTRGSMIVNLSDAGSSRIWLGYGAYQISKNGVDSLTRILARELAPEIRVCGIAPGLLLKADNMPDEVWNQLVQKTPLKRACTMESLYSAIDLLLANEYITGEIIHLDGGSNLQ